MQGYEADGELDDFVDPNAISRNSSRVYTYTFQSTDVPSSSIPSSFDWSKKYKVPIANQGSCGGCWAFAATSTLAYYNARYCKSGVVSLSEQQLMNCVYPDRTPCESGTMRKAFGWVQSNGGIASNKEIPFVDSTQVSRTTQTDAINSSHPRKCRARRRRRSCTRTFTNSIAFRTSA